MRSVIELQADTVAEDEDVRWSGASISACSGFSGISLAWCGPYSVRVLVDPVVEP